MRRMLMSLLVVLSLCVAVPAQASGSVMAVGQAAPEFTLTTLAGGQMALSSLKGHPVILNFFASWCHNCQGEMPELAKVSAAYAGKIEVLAVNLTSSESSLAVVRRFIKQYGFQGPVLLDRTGAVTARYLVNAIPMTVAISKDGTVVMAAPGQHTYKGLMAIFDAARSGRSLAS